MSSLVLASEIHLGLQIQVLNLDHSVFRAGIFLLRAVDRSAGATISEAKPNAKVVSGLSVVGLKHFQIKT